MCTSSKIFDALIMKFTKKTKMVIIFMAATSHQNNNTVLFYAKVPKIQFGIFGNFVIFTRT